jgi:RNA polymerase sigma-70 factor (sigma-E family)
VLFEDFVQASLRPMVGLGHAMTADKDLAEDLVQDVFVKAHVRWARIGELEDPAAYVRRMLVNEYVSWRRKWARLVPVAAVEVQDSSPDPAVQLSDRDALRIQLAALSRMQRAVLALRYYADMSDLEIAHTLACSISTVRSHASRALAALRTDADALIPNGTEGYTDGH